MRATDPGGTEGHDFTEMPAARDPASDLRMFRRALGSFGTGVMVVTTGGSSCGAAGVTINSFSSVSLSPPLVLWCLALAAPSLETFRRGTHFAVHVLAATQRDIAVRFATPAEDKFAGLETLAAPSGVPLLPDVSALFECRKTGTFDGGDHLVLMGEVERYADFGRDPLLFVRGRFMAVDAATPLEDGGLLAEDLTWAGDLALSV